MVESDWEKLEHFSIREKWGSADKMDLQFMYLLDTVRDLFGEPFVIHCGTQGSHSKNSYHYKGRAADFHVLNMEPLDALSDMRGIIDEIGIAVGFGFYPDWNSPGFHFDDRGRDGKESKRWVRIDNIKHGMPRDYYYDEHADDIIDRLIWERRIL